ncbi:MAG: IS630 family transposase [Desulfobacteraceae bacterium]|nr:MAG: IS630 family transposase [Desulfobacteraceae bacterium]
MKIRDARSLPGIAQSDLRKKAIQRILDGVTQIEVAKIFGVTRQAVGKWVAAYREGGEKALREKRRGRPKGGSLLPWQAAQIAKVVIDRTPDQLKLPFYLWTREAVSQVIEKRFGIRISVWTVGRYLSRWDFTPQKPIRRAFERDPQAVQEWLKKDYPAIREQAKREKALIFWGDEMGLRSDHCAGRSYGKCGQTPVIPGTGQRFKCNMISAITNKGKLNFMIFKQKFSWEVFLDFIRRLTRQCTQMVFLIVDGHSVHRSHQVRDWISAHPGRIKLFFLPGYSPELNPDELLNQDAKTNALGRKRPHNIIEMISTLRSFLWSRQQTPHIVKKYFQAKSVQYASL